MKPFVGAKVTWEGDNEGYYIVTKVAPDSSWHGDFFGNRNEAYARDKGPFREHQFVEADERLMNYKEHYLRLFKKLYYK